MVNMAVPMSRPDLALLTLRDEVYAAYGYTPARASEFVTGYKSPDNFTGHNADSNGIVHAVDIFTDENGNLPEAEGRELAEKLRLIGKATNRFAYLIHDMCPDAGVAWPRIAGQFNGWAWQEYTGTSPHTDHIHVSMCDLYWGDPAPVPASVYDNTAPWGIAGIAPAGNITTAPPKEVDELSAEDIEQINQKLDNLAGYLLYGYKSGGVNRPGIAAVVDAIPGKVWSATVNRGDKKVPALQELADIKTSVLNLGPAVAEIQANTDPATLAALIPDALAQQVIDKLSARLAGKAE